MSYKNGKNLLPEFLLLQIQEYVQGEIIYIPRKEPGRAGWGEANGTKQEFRSRNEEIRKLSQKGLKIGELAEQYHLSEHSIRKILQHRVESEEALTCVSYSVTSDELKKTIRDFELGVKALKQTVNSLTRTSQ